MNLLYECIQHFGNNSVVSHHSCSHQTGPHSHRCSHTLCWAPHTRCCCTWTYSRDKGAGALWIRNKVMNLTQFWKEASWKKTWWSVQMKQVAYLAGCSCWNLCHLWQRVRAWWRPWRLQTGWWSAEAFDQQLPHRDATNLHGYQIATTMLWSWDPPLTPHSALQHL